MRPRNCAPPLQFLRGESNFPNFSSSFFAQRTFPIVLRITSRRKNGTIISNEGPRARRTTRRRHEWKFCISIDFTIRINSSNKKRCILFSYNYFHIIFRRPFSFRRVNIIRWLKRKKSQANRWTLIWCSASRSRLGKKERFVRGSCVDARWCKLNCANLLTDRECPFNERAKRRATFIMLFAPSRNQDTILI